MERKRKNVWRGPNADELPIPLIESKSFIFVMRRFSRYRGKGSAARDERIRTTCLAVERKKRRWIDAVPAAFREQ